MTQRLFLYTIFTKKIFFALVLMGLHVPSLHASRRDRMRKHKQQIAMLVQDTQDPIEEQLGIPQPASEVTQVEVYTPQETPLTQEELQEEQELPLVVTESVDQKEVPTPAEDKIELYFENADLEVFKNQIADIFDIDFITDDNLDPLPQGGRSLRGNKISYRTIVPITRAQAWSIFTTFLNIAGFNIIPQAVNRTYRIAPITVAQRGPIPTYIGVDATTLPDSDELVRFVYFIENNTVEAIKAVIEQFRSATSSAALYLNEHKGFILTDTAYNIKKLMEIIRELDKISMPESLSVLKLRRADAKQVKDLYDSLTQKESDQRFGPRQMNRRQPESLALPENVTLIAEPRTNSLIILGPQSARERIEQFIIKHVDVELDQAYSPLHTYQLRYANAESIAKIMNDVTKFGADTDAGRSGGIRGGDQYMRPISFVPEPTTNRLVIKGHYDDFLKAVEVIKTLDVDQPQIAIEVLILSVDINKNKELGSQIRSKLTEATIGADA